MHCEEERAKCFSELQITYWDNFSEHAILSSPEQCVGAMDGATAQDLHSWTLKMIATSKWGWGRNCSNTSGSWKTRGCCLGKR